MTDRDDMQNHLGDEKEPVVVKKKEIDSPKSNRKRKSVEKTPVKNKRVQIESDQQLSSQSPEPCCSAATVENVLEDMEEEIDNALEQPCYKDKLTPTNVKSILRHIIANEYVLTMVRSTMNPTEEGELDDIAFEPKLTRSKAKEMRKQQCSLPWPVASPAKTVQNKKLLEEEFPDESSGDEDYKPEEECHSEDDDAAASSKASDAGTPRSRRMSIPSSPVSKTADLMSEDENALVIALPELEIPFDSTEADKIALRTRSKLCLNDTPLEEIEASFIAPDITVDMYDTCCDNKDWQSFLYELCKPIDSTGTHDHPDDNENDPEYKAIEDESPDYEDLRYERITTDEWNDLMLGTYELAQEDLSFLDDENEEDAEFSENVGTPSICVKNVIWMTSDERLQLDEQLRMYVQLLIQSHLLSHGNSALEHLEMSTKIFLEEMKMFATRERVSAEPSAFNAYNLDGALDVVKKFETINLPSDLMKTKQRKCLPPVPPHIMKTLASNKVFIYPELLPICGFHSTIKISKFFNTPEDNLIALGLEQFEGLKDPAECIHKYLIPIKSIKQISGRIKNCKLKRSGTNSIKFYHKHKQAPKFQRVIRIFDPHNIKAAEDYPPDFLPKWMESFSKFTNTDTGTVPASSEKPSLKVQLSPVRKALIPRKYIPILPRGPFFTTLHHINPILKKYSQRKRCAPSICDSESPYKPPPLRILRPKPKPSNPIPESNEASSFSCAPSTCDSESPCESPAVSICDSKSPYKSPPLSICEPESPYKSPLLSICESESPYKSPPLSICDSESSYKPPSLRTKSSDPNPESNEASSDSNETTKCGTKAQDKAVMEDAKNTPNENDSASVESVVCAQRRKKRQAARQAVWVTLSGCESSSVTRSSKKGKALSAKVFDIDNEICDNEQESVVETASTREKKKCPKRKPNLHHKDLGQESVVETASTREKKKCPKKKPNLHHKDLGQESVVETASTREKKKCPKKKPNLHHKDLGQESVVETASTREKKKCPKKKPNLHHKDLGQESVVETASTREKKKCPKKKPNLHHKDLETSLALLQPPPVEDVPVKEEHEVMFANSYLLRATEILKGDSEVYEKFLSTLCKYHLSTESPVELYSELKEILKDYPFLVRDFIVFLRPEQAKQCGRYKEHVALSKVREFFRTIEIHFKDQPEQISEILRTFAQLREQVDLTSAEIISAFQPLLKNQPNLFQELNDLLSSNK